MSPKLRSLLPLLLLASLLNAATVTTTVCKWKDDKSAAFTLGADDGCGSQLDNMIPALKARGLVATFWIIANAGQFTARLTEWRTAARVNGNDFANHSMTATNVPDYLAADSEIGGCARRIWSLNPAQGKLQLFHPGGGVTWSITSQQRTELLTKYNVFPKWDEAGRGNGIHDGMYSDHDAATLKSYVDNAIRDGEWHFTIFHGIGGDWISQNVPAFIELLDYMVTKKSTVWFPTCTQAHKYREERLTAQVSVVEATDAVIRVNLTSTMDTGLYNYPLTLKTTGVPATWDSCRVTQGSTTAAFPVIGGTVLYYALPSKGEISLRKNVSTSLAPGLRNRADAAAGIRERLTAHATRSSVDVQYRLHTEGRVTIRLSTLQGALVSTLVDATMSAGRHSVSKDLGAEGAHNLKNGMYIVSAVLPDGFHAVRATAQTN